MVRGKIIKQNTSYKPYYLALAATLLAAGSYYAAWSNIKGLKYDELPVSKIIEAPVIIENSASKLLSMTQAEVSATIDVLNTIEVIETKPLKHWQTVSKAKPLKPGKSYIAIVIDDVGVVHDRSLRSIENLPPEVTLAFLPYGEATASLSKKAFEMGHEIMVHLPMQPKLSADGKVVNPGEGALYTNLSLPEISSLVTKNITDLAPIAVGVNNHMGSSFTEWYEGLDAVFKVLETHELMFLDSVTTAKSAASKAVQQYDIPFLKRDVFLDHIIEKTKIREALEKSVRIAKKRGSAIAIGHPHTETTDAIMLWAKTLEARNIQLVPITALIKGN